jgi:hypothetical protein
MWLSFLFLFAFSAPAAAATIHLEQTISAELGSVGSKEKVWGGLWVIGKTRTGCFEFFPIMCIGAFSENMTTCQIHL